MLFVFSLWFVDSYQQHHWILKRSCFHNKPHGLLLSSFRFSWYYNHQVLDSQDYSLSVVSPDAFTSSLSFSNLTTRHSGNYTCEARNAASFHMHSAHLIVNGNDFFRIFSIRRDKAQYCSFHFDSFFLFQYHPNGYLLQKILMSDLAVLVMWNVRRLVFLNPKYHGSVWWRIPLTHIRANSLKCQRKAHISSKVIIFLNFFNAYMYIRGQTGILESMSMPLNSISKWLTPL